METGDAIETRRSVREFSDEQVGEAELDRVLDAARWAPSGLNNQPWRFMKIRDREVINGLAELTKYRGLVRSAPILLAVFLDVNDSYDRVKDLQSTGAAIQNMLLMAHDMGLGACWLGEILNRRREAESLLGVPGDLELMALVAVGRPVARERTGVRHPLSSLVVPPPAGAPGPGPHDGP